MRDNPSLVPEKMVAFEINTNNKGEKAKHTKKKLLGQSALRRKEVTQGGEESLCSVRTGEGNPPTSVRRTPEGQSTRSHRTSLSSAALWKENTRCCM